jgi:uncharacterized protein (DUF2236 family)
MTRAQEVVGEIQPNQLIVPRDVDAVLYFGAMHLPEGTSFRFDPQDSQFFKAITSTANLGFVLAAGALELGDASIAHGVVGAESSIFRQTAERIIRSARMIGGIAIADDPLEAGAKIRRIHEHIYGLGQNGERVPATDPYVYAKGWLPIVWMMEQSLLRMGTSEVGMNNWYKETLVAFQSQGVSDEFVPKTYAEYLEAIEQFSAAVGKTEATDRFREHGVAKPPVLPDFVWDRPYIRHVVNAFARASTVQTLPRDVVERIEYGDNLSWPYRTLAALGVAMTTQIAKRGPKMLRHHPDHVSHIYPPSRLQEVQRRASAFATSKLFGC